MNTGDPLPHWASSTTTTTTTASGGIEDIVPLAPGWYATYLDPNGDVELVGIIALGRYVDFESGSPGSKWSPCFVDGETGALTPVSFTTDSWRGSLWINMIYIDPARLPFMNMDTIHIDDLVRLVPTFRAEYDFVVRQSVEDKLGVTEEGPADGSSSAKL